MAAILNFVVTSEGPGTREYWEVWEFTICTSPIIHLVCSPPPLKNFANAFFTRCFQQNIFRTFMGSIYTESILGSLFFFLITCMRKFRLNQHGPFCTVCNVQICHLFRLLSALHTYFVLFITLDSRYF